MNSARLPRAAVRFGRHQLPAFLAFTSMSVLPTTPATEGPPVERVIANDNRTPAGTLRGDTLSLLLEVRRGEWRPDGDSSPGISILAFAEQGRGLSNPGPLIRVPRGTEIRAVIRNTLIDTTLTLRGLSARGAASAEDSVQVGPGETREVRFRASTAGTYHYWGTTTGARDMARRLGVESQLNGAFVVDARSPDAATPDRIFLIGLWLERGVGAQINRSAALRFVINGRSWPNTESLRYTVGDTVRFRLINSSAAPHPMHLHGFYFNVDSRGDIRRDSTYATGSPNLVVTERLTPGRTFTMTWVPERPGNWMFHCHDNFHVLRNRPLDGTPLPPEHKQHVRNHARDMMGGLVMGVEVLPKPSSASSEITTAVARRRLRLVARIDSGSTDDEPAYGYVLEEGRTRMPVRSPLLPGPTILLTRGEPVSIMVVNELPEPTAVHWHGIELESYYDGVADFAGSGQRIAPAIAPRDSFEALFTPPRSGTFMYHPHADEVRQQQAGLSGAIIVVDDRKSFDAEHDIPVLISVPRRDQDGGTVLLNGSATPAERELRAGERYRVRIINIHTYRPSMIVRLMRDSTLLTWRAVAKDGMALPPERSIVEPALQQLGNGEAYDFEFVPAGPEPLKLSVTTGANAPLNALTFRVRR